MNFPSERPPDREGEERRVWERLRRTLLNLVAQMQDGVPESRYTLDIRIVPKDRQTPAPR